MAPATPWEGSRQEAQTSVAVGPSSALVLPVRAWTAPGCQLTAAPPTAGAGRIQEAPAERKPPQKTPFGVGPAWPAARGIPGCLDDLCWPEPAPVELRPVDRERVPHDRPREAPLEVSMLFQARPCQPIAHRFERLPSERALAPALTVLRLWRRIPTRVAVPLAALLLLIPLGAVLWSSVRESVRQRATVTIDEGFAAGLQRWTAGASDWSRDPASFVEVGSLALLTPSLRMSDYRLEFMGEIGRQSLAWVFRARDTENYYAMKIVVLESGPLPTLALVHYRVLGGEAGPAVQVPLRVMLHSGRPLRVQMRAQGADFTTFIEQQQVDFWSDDRFPSGGVGFFSEKGSRARLYWVKVTHQADLLGRLCSYFAPNDPSKDGSWK